MKKKLLTMVLAGAMAVSMMAGCGSSSSGSDSSSSDATASTDASASSDSSDSSTASANVASEGDKELSVYAWDENFNIPALKAAEAAYQKKDPDFKLNIITQGQSSDVEDAVTLAGSAGDYSTLPDIVLFQDHYINQYVTNYPDAWVSVDDANVNWDDFSQEKLSYSTISGTHYGFPVDNGTAIFAYRTDLLEQAGYTIDDVTGVTWEKWIQIGKDVYDKTGKYLMAMDGDGNDLPYMMLQAEGVSQFKDGKPNFVNNEAMVQIMGVIRDAVQNNALLLCTDWSDYTDKAIQGDQVAGVMNGNWIIPTIEQVAENSGKWEITTMPTLSGAEGYAANGGSSLYITAACQKTDLAKDFLAYTFGGGDGAQETYDNALTNGGVISTWAKAADSDVYQQGVAYFNNQPIYAKIVEMGTHVSPVEQSDYHYPTRTDIATAIHNVIDNGADITAELQTAEDDINFQMGN